MAGGGGAKKLIINFIVDNPAKVYLGGGALLWVVRKYQIQTTYNTYFGKFDYQRRVERGQLH
jgi:hypothetical protein